MTVVDASYFRPDAVLKRLTSRAMMELQSGLTDLYGRPIGFNVKDDVPQTTKYACASCFTEGRPQVQRDIATGSKFPKCPACGERALWIKLPSPPSET